MSKYFTEPSAWRRLREKEYMKVAGQMNFHKVAIAEVKRRMGKSCTYLTHLKTKGTIWFLAHLDIKGENRIVRVNTGKTSADQLVAENYKALNQQLADYVTGKKSI